MLLYLFGGFRTWVLLSSLPPLLFVCAISDLTAQSTWTGAAGGQNSNRWAGARSNQNWDPNIIPNAIGATALFADNDTALDGRSINLNSTNITIGTLSISNTVGASFAIGGAAGDSFTFNNSGSASITLTGNSNTDLIGASIIVAAGNTFNVNHSGTGTLSLGDINAGANTVTFNSSGTTIQAGAISGTGKVIKSGSGNLTLTGTIATSEIDIQAGTLLLGANERVSDSTGVTLSGGTLKLDGFSETLGALTLSADSVIDFSGGDSVLQFADSSGIAWDPNATLTIINWSGKPALGGGADQIFFGSSDSGLTADQRSQIVFANYANENIQLNSGEVVPIPEPATIFIGLGLFVFAICHGFRKVSKRNHPEVLLVS